MSQLLEVLRGDDGSKHCWSGRLELPYLPPPIAEPIVLAWKENASIVLSAGALNDLAAMELGTLVLSEARRPENRLVYVALAMQGGQLGALSALEGILVEARQHAAIVAYLTEVAFGPALWIAYRCDLVFSHPLTSFGWLECFSHAGEFNSDATMAMIADLAATNPAVAPSTFARLTQWSTVAEQAEALGIIQPGTLKRSVFELSEIDGNKKMLRPRE